MNILQTSASDRQEAARKALAEYERWWGNSDQAPQLRGLADALRALITPPNVAESEEAIVARVILESLAAWSPQDDVASVTNSLAVRAVRAGIQAAHETWEPADHPSQEMMLRWLGLDYWDGYADDGTNTWKIAAQSIEKEED